MNLYTRAKQLNATAISAPLLRPFVIDTGQITEAQFEDLFTRMQEEISERNFYGVCPLHTIIAFNNVPRIFP